jgi:hypothetical protein
LFTSVVVASSFNATLASIGLDLSNAAYCDKNEIEKWTCKPCLRLAAAGIYTPSGGVRIIDGDVGGFGKVKLFGTRAFVSLLGPQNASSGSSSHNGRIVISFRGSANLTNWIEDFDIQTLVPYLGCPRCLVHEGFYLSWLSVARDVTSAVKALLVSAPDSDILVTGHSLGAAMAVLCAAHLYHVDGLPVTQVYTYGQPRVGNAAFHKFFNGRDDTRSLQNDTDTASGSRGRHFDDGRSPAPAMTAFRVVHWRDPVPRLPPAVPWLLGFQHTSTEVWYNELSTNYSVCDGSGEDPNCSISLPLDPFAAKDHTSYLHRPTGGSSC